jgi:long-chain acyl-CoA synthetase
VRGETVSQSSWEGGQIQQRASEWLATGDLASVDAAGNLTFKGRKKEVIVTAAGLNIYPDDLEAALLRQPQVAAAAVVEAAGPNGSEPVAALVLRDSADPGEAVRAANQELAEYQQIRRWVIWPDADLPRTSTGKIRRGEIAAALRTTPGQPGVIQSSGGALETLIGRITGENVAHVSDSALLSEDLRLDSLGRVELQAALESQYGAQLDDSRYRQVRTLGELKGLITPAAAPPSQREEHTYSLWPWSRLQSAIRIAFIELVMRPLVAILGKPLVQRDFTDDELSPPVLIVSNHVTAFDVPLILHALPGPVRRRVAVAMAGEMLLDWRKARAQGNPFLNVLAPLEYLLVTALFNVFPLPQQGNFRKSFAHAGRAMDRGFHVMVFPEGRRSSDGLMHSFQSGAGLLWKDLQARALPVYLGGLGELKAESKWLRSGRLSIRIGQPIPYNADVDVQQATRILEQAVRDLAIMDG